MSKGDVTVGGLAGALGLTLPIARSLEQLTPEERRTFVMAMTRLDTELRRPSP